MGPTSQGVEGIHVRPTLTNGRSPTTHFSRSTPAIPRVAPVVRPPLRIQANDKPSITSEGTNLVLNAVDVVMATADATTSIADVLAALAASKETASFWPSM